MNIIAVNKYRSMFNSLGLESIKVFDGEYEINDLLNEVKNTFFDKLIIDITAIKDYKNPEVISALAININPNKIIIFLDDSVETTSSSYLKELIGMGIYNFATSINGIIYLCNNPNSYKDVAYIRGGA